MNPESVGPHVLVGTIDVRLTGVGSKSEMWSVVLVPDEPGSEPVALRRRHAVALDAEPELTVYRGKHVRVTGSQGWTTFVVDEIEEL